VDAVSLSPNDVTAVLVTRGDCDLSPILESLVFRNVLVWDNARQQDLGAYGRYEALGSVFTEHVFVQDDDCIVDPEAQLALLAEFDHHGIVANMPTHWNGSGMPLLALPGWGAVFHRLHPHVAFLRWQEAEPDDWHSADFNRIGCDIVFPVLTPSRMIDLGHTNLEHAEAANRTCKQPGYQLKKSWYYERAEAILTGAPVLRGASSQ
jgi:hypothetical protein